MKPDNRSYEYLITKFTETVLIERYNVIYEGATDYIKEANLTDCTVVNEFIIDEILLDYFADIDRLKDFHHIEKAEPKKVAAYTSYWVHKRKPIQFIKNPSEELILQFPQIKWINENFAISLLLSLAFNMGKPSAVPAETINEFTHFHKSLRYYFTYRHINPQMLELLLKAINITNLYPSITDSN